MINKLLTDHDHIRRSLDLLEIQFLDLCRNKKPDLSIMRSIVAYIHEYPEISHHPLEDMIYSFLLKRDKKIKLLQNLLSDHTELESITRKLRESLELYIQGDFSEKELKNLISKFLIRQRQHIYIEEMEVYPLSECTLTENDWKKIQSIAPCQDDPVFGKRTKEDYEMLHRKIEGK